MFPGEKFGTLTPVPQKWEEVFRIILLPEIDYYLESVGLLGALK